MARNFILIAHNLRSAHNVGSLFRTAEGLGVDKIWLTGYSPYPLRENDARLPHLSGKINRQIQKTALGAEEMDWDHSDDIEPVIERLKREGWVIAALEQSDESVPLSAYRPPAKLALIAGREVEGIEPEVQKLCDVILEIPMKGRKESFNVAQASAMALYQLTLGS